MRCAEAKRLMRKALAGDAAASEERLDEHMTTCPGCAGQWATMTRLADAVRVAVPTALAIEGDIAAEVGERLGGGGSLGGEQAARVKGLVLRVAAAAIVLGAVAWLVTRSTSGNGLLSVVEAAMKEQPRHSVMRAWDGQGKLLSRMERWRAPNGDGYTELEFVSDGRGTRTWSRKRWNIYWSYWSVFDTYMLTWAGTGWHTGMRDELRQLEGKGKERISGLHLPAVLEEDWAPAIGLIVAKQNQDVVEKSDKGGEFKGQKVRIVEIRTAPSGKTPSQEGGPERAGGWLFRYYLTADSRRVVGMIMRSYDEHGKCAVVYQMWPIEYEVEPPASLFELEFPAGAKITFEGKEIDALWEHMDEVGRQRIIGTVYAVAEAWRNGDFEEFEKHYDFAAGLEYGVKGKWTAEARRERWKWRVERQPERWADQELTVDYGFGTCEPPAMALSNWSIYREKPQSGDGWILYRQEPSTEPGIIVLARVKVTDTEGETVELGTQLFLKEIGGEYKVILWRPPFG